MDLYEDPTGGGDLPDTEGAGSSSPRFVPRDREAGGAEIVSLGVQPVENRRKALSHRETAVIENRDRGRAAELTRQLLAFSRSQPQDAQIFDLDGWIIPAGLSEERQKRALDYIMFATDTQRLADQAKYISYGPARASSAPLVGQHADLGIDMAPHMPTDPNNAQNTFLYNYEFWADYRDDIDAKFQAWLAK